MIIGNVCVAAVALLSWLSHKYFVDSLSSYVFMASLPLCECCLLGVLLFNDSMTPENMTPTKLKDDSRWLVRVRVSVSVRVRINYWVIIGKL